MSAYDPPSETIGVFNSSLFTSTSENITQSYADTHYLKYPNSQSATETITSLVVSNDLTCTNDATINGVSVGKGGGGNQSIAIGYEALLNKTGNVDNVGIGYKALQASNGGDNNTAVGNWALNASTNSNNVGIGYKAGGSNTGGFNNVYVGFEAGVAGGTPNINGDNNTFIGYQAQTSGNSFNNSTALGVGARISASNEVVLGTSTETVRYNKCSNLYTSLPSFNVGDIGYYHSDTIATNTNIQTTALLTYRITNLAIGRYIVMVATNYESKNSSATMNITTTLNVEVSGVLLPVFTNVNTVRALDEYFMSFTIPVAITDATYDLSLYAVCSIGNFDVNDGYIYAMKIA